MSWALFRLTELSVRRAFGRLAFIAVGTAFGTVLLLLLLGGRRALGVRDDRTAWLEMPPSARPVAASPLSQPAVPGPGQAFVVVSNDHIHGRPIARVELASSPGQPLLMPDGTPAPVPGTYLASPALASLVASTPAEALGQRWGSLAGQLSPTLVAGPDDLVVVAGRSPAALTGAAGQRVQVIDSFNASPSRRSSEFRALILVGAVAVLFPVVLFVNIVTQLGAQARRERDATLHIIGASPALVRRMAVAELAAVTLLGTVSGWLVSMPLRATAARVSLAGNRPYPRDLALPHPVSLATMAGVVVVAALAAAWRLRRIDLGRRPHRAEGRVRWWRALPLAIGLAAVAACGAFRLGDPWVIPTSTAGLLIGAVGVVTIGPWLTAVAAHVVGRRATTAEGLMAARRISAYPKATFRSVSGLVLALFMSSVLTGLAGPTSRATNRLSGPSALPADAVVAVLDDAAATTVEKLDSVEAAASVTVVQRPAGPVDDPEKQIWLTTPDGARAIGFTSVPVAPLVQFRAFDYLNAQAYGGPRHAALEPATASQARSLVASAVIVRTDGTSDAVERARTALDRALGPLAQPPYTASERAADQLVSVSELQALADLGVGVSMAVAACSLAVATVAAVLERRRSIGLLRLIGMPLRRLGSLAVYETIVPLVAVSALAAMAGFGFAFLLLDLLSAFEPTWPGTGYLAVIGAGWTMAAIGAAVSVLVIRKHTGLRSTRFE